MSEYCNCTEIERYTYTIEYLVSTVDLIANTMPNTVRLCVLNYGNRVSQL